MSRAALRRLRAPFPYFGSKYDIADEVWARKPSLDGGNGRARNGHGVHRTELSNPLELHQKRPALIGQGDEFLLFT